MRKFAFLTALFFTGCAANTVLSPTYDFTHMRRIGVLAFDAPRPMRGAENVFAKYFMKEGFTVVERAGLEKVLAEHNISVSGFMSPSTTKKIGQILGVDVLLTGEITGYTPPKTTVAMVENRSVKSEPVYTTSRYTNPDGTVNEITSASGTRVTHSAETTPTEYTVSARAGITAKLIDVETAEVVWLGSEAATGSTGMSAIDGAAKRMVGDFKKQYNKLTLKE